MYLVATDDAFVVVDPQNDFLPGGTLAVPDGNRIFEPINRLLPVFRYVVATRDWHPQDHAYFRANGGPWPWHCLAGTPGAAFSPLLDASEVDDIISKGTDPKTDGYSGFVGTDLEQRLRAQGIRRLFVGGLATDYCVKRTTIDALDAGFDAVVVTDCIAAIDLSAGDERRALDEMRARGAHFAHSHNITAA